LPHLICGTLLHDTGDVPYENITFKSFFASFFQEKKRDRPRLRGQGQNPIYTNLVENPKNQGNLADYVL
jgi:hypothetical protein